MSFVKFSRTHFTLIFSVNSSFRFHPIPLSLSPSPFSITNKQTYNCSVYISMFLSVSVVCFFRSSVCLILFYFVLLINRESCLCVCTVYKRCMVVLLLIIPHFQYDTSLSYCFLKWNGSERTFNRKYDFKKRISIQSQWDSYVTFNVEKRPREGGRRNSVGVSEHARERLQEKRNLRWSWYHVIWDDND